MKDIEYAHRAVAIIGEALGLELEMDSSHGCSFAFEQVHRLDLRLPCERAFTIRAELVRAAPDHRPERLAAALKLNKTYGAETRNFGYDAEVERIVFESTVDATGQDSLEIAERLADECVFAAHSADSLRLTESDLTTVSTTASDPASFPVLHV
ncbi:MAG: hypothetical protein AAGC81_07005 [Pseudomonadota bacterium]